MKTLHLFKKRIPLILAVFCACVTAVISGTVNMRGGAKQASAAAAQKKVIVIDAGHEASVIN